jgi:hypothetical protein
MSEEKTEEPKPVFHGAPSGTTSPPSAENKFDKTFAAGVAVGIGSAALVAALLYARKVKEKPAAPTVAPEPSD